MSQHEVKLTLRAVRAAVRSPMGSATRLILLACCLLPHSLGFAGVPLRATRQRQRLVRAAAASDDGVEELLARAAALREEARALEGDIDAPPAAAAAEEPVAAVDPDRPLVGSTWDATLDVGRETGTWQPQRWAQQNRAVFSARLTILPGGRVSVADVRGAKGVAMGTGARWPMEGGRWATEGGMLRICLDHAGLEVSDVTLEAGELYLGVPYFGGRNVSQKPGTMTIIAYRFVVRKERRIVGTFVMKAAAG